MDIHSLFGAPPHRAALAHWQCATLKSTSLVRRTVLKIARGGANWVIAPIVVAILMVGLATPLGRPELVSLSTVPFFLAILLLTFFRDPERTPGPGIVSGADGKVRAIEQVDDPDVGPAHRLSIFMRPQDVHVNRFPIAGDVRMVTRRPGAHVPAFRKDSDKNERAEILMQTELGPVKLIQIAGTVARRVVPYAQSGQHAKKGDRLGLIRLSSRFDLLIPEGKIQWTVAEGERVWAGRTQVATVREAPQQAKSTRKEEPVADTRSEQHPGGAT